MPYRLKSKSFVIIIICMILFTEFLSLGLIIPVLPNIIVNLTDTTISRAATFAGWLAFTFGITQLLFAPVIGSLSDRYGRKPILLTSLIALSINYGLIAAAPNLFWLFAGRAVSGVAGATWPAAASCVADISAGHNRTKAMAKLSASCAAGYIFAPALGGILGEIDVRWPFWAACLLTSGAATVSAFFLKETLLNKKSLYPTLSRLNPVCSFQKLIKDRHIAPVLIAMLFLNLSTQAQISIWAFYGIEKFNWGPIDIGITLVVFGISFVSVQLFATAPIIRILGEYKTAVISVSIGIPTYVILAFAEIPFWAIFGIFLGSLTAIAQPSMNSLMMNFTDDKSQGELQGVISSLTSLSIIVGAPAMSYVFSVFSTENIIYFPGAPFIISALFAMISLFILLRYRSQIYGN